MAHDTLSPLPWQTIPQRRQDSAGTNEIDAQGLKVEGEVARHAVEAGGVAGDEGPVLVRVGADGAGGQGCVNGYVRDLSYARAGPIKDFEAGRKALIDME